MGKRKGKCSKKNPAGKDALEPEHLVKAPHSFVIHRGNCSKDLIDLTKDFRKVMEPFTASQLKERKKNTIKDFLSVSGYLHVSHMMTFTETELGTYMRLARLPRGPTLTFRIHNVVLGKVPNLNRCKDMSEFFDKAALLSESEFEDEQQCQVVLPQSLASRGAAAESKSAIRLYELGPRISFQLIKIEDGLMDGEVLFHELIDKTEEEKALIKKRREEKKRLKEKRKSQQEDNVKRKLREKEELKQKALEGIKKKKEMTESQRLMELAAAESQNAADMDQDDENDADYYRKEVGAEPEKDLFSENTSRKRKADDNSVRGFKKMRLDKKLKKKYQKNQDTEKANKKNKGDKRFGRNQEEGKRKFNNKPDGRRNKGPPGKGQKPLNNQKKVFGGKFNKNKTARSREGKGKGKGKNRK
ncbi:hypothetical protein evm_011037 [Chilo suppressalis]|nr:hypothetical protein evm_011037 [Chilo suppressalis]